MGSLTELVKAYVERLKETTVGAYVEGLGRRVKATPPPRPPPRPPGIQPGISGEKVPAISTTRPDPRCGPAPTLPCRAGQKWRCDVTTGYKWTCYPPL